MLQHKVLKQRLAVEFRHAATQMQQATGAPKILFYFSVLFGESQRVLNFEWDRDLALIHSVTKRAYDQINGASQGQGQGSPLPIDWPTVFQRLVQTTSDLAAYFENMEDNTDGQELYQILGRIAELTYVVTGNGSYLCEKGLLKL